MPELEPKNVQMNAFTDNLTDNEYIAVNAAGIPVARGLDRDKLESAAPNGQIFSGAYFGVKDETPATETPELVEDTAPKQVTKTRKSRKKKN